MAYSNNPNLAKARAIAMRLLLREALPVATVANKCGVHRSTVWRWKQKWLKLNENVQFDNPNRPGRSVSFKNKLEACKWLIKTLSSRPHTCSHAISEKTIRRVMELRSIFKRCAEVIWNHMNRTDGIARVVGIEVIKDTTYPLVILIFTVILGYLSYNLIGNNVMVSGYLHI